MALETLLMKHVTFHCQIELSSSPDDPAQPLTAATSALHELVVVIRPQHLAHAIENAIATPKLVLAYLDPTTCPHA